MIEEHSQLRIKSVLEVISDLKKADFPYSHSKSALEKVEELFVQLGEDLSDTINRGDQDLIRNICTTILEQIVQMLPVIGFILRSTNVRNAFEVHGPLLTLSRLLLGDEIKLLISSEWSYSPYTYLPISSLKNFVFIGFPATESSNPLVLPLAGHELGHSIWIKNNLESDFTTPITESILENIRKNKWPEFKALFPGTSKKPEELGQGVFDLSATAPSTAWALYQVQESFCDFLGLKLFGFSFLYAFAHLLAPGGRSRVHYYPSLPTRVANLVTSANKYSVIVPPGFDDMATNYPTPSDWTVRETFLVSLADDALSSNIDSIIDLAEIEAGKAKDQFPKDGEDMDIVKKCLAIGVPCEKSGNLPNILNAAWLLQSDDSLWKVSPNIENKNSLLRELVLKSIEILEFETRTKIAK